LALISHNHCGHLPNFHVLQHILKSFNQYTKTMRRTVNPSKDPEKVKEKKERKEAKEDNRKRLVKQNSLSFFFFCGTQFHF
jgi:hypothetical protein